MKLLKAKFYNPGNKVEIKQEPYIDNIKFNIFKFSNIDKPPDNDIVYISCFSEFGCEILGVLYSIDIIKKQNPNKYFIVLGWYGREYLYKHLVDEFWELKPELMWLREYARAFHNVSKNIKILEKNIANYSKIITTKNMGNYYIYSNCKNCKYTWSTITKSDQCPKCNSNFLNKSIYSDVSYYKKIATKIPSPSSHVMNDAKLLLKNNPVGIFARNRQCYGRNLPSEFYIKLIENLKNLGYNPIWLGEEQSTLKCPVDYIVDFSRDPRSRNLEYTLAIIKQLEFTIQFWTASSRLSAIMEVPYILFESPDQIWGAGQEGYRLNLTTTGNKKLVISHYLNVLNNQNKAIELVNQAIDELKNNNFKEIFGLLDTNNASLYLKNINDLRIGNKNDNNSTTNITESC
jgi:predicted Zn-ribbon and HTH transcriptional regulator